MIINYIFCYPCAICENIHQCKNDCDPHLTLILDRPLCQNVMQCVSTLKPDDKLKKDKQKA